MGEEDAGGQRDARSRHSTTRVGAELNVVRRARLIRRAFIFVLVVFLLLGVVGVFGVRSTQARASGGGYDIEVDYARVTRAGLATPWTVTVRREGGFDGSVKVSTTSNYLTMFDQNTLEPEPQSTTTDGERIIWEFDVPDGSDTLEISLDASATASAKWTYSGETAVLDGEDSEEPLVLVRYKTLVMP